MSCRFDIPMKTFQVINHVQDLDNGMQLIQPTLSLYLCNYNSQIVFLVYVYFSTSYIFNIYLQVKIFKEVAESQLLAPEPEKPNMYFL